ncbi:DnaB-like helicase N-terminal domain-containing protein [Kitasatospora sp. NPDC004669]|uniref:DnaB-like helicase N-terminal domain-containing protein n=1 Tax=Kitasatospora sp. NPDC004669 TaxID=3154555 RepID=UPI0033BCD23C
MNPQMEAEQALLGALLLDARQVDSVAGWLEPRHFYRPAHASLFTALLAQRAAGHRALAEGATKEERRGWALEAMATAGQASRGFTASYGHTLIAACSRSDHAASYGRMVLETAIRRALEEHAHRLLHAAETGSVQAAVELTGVLRSAIRQLADVWGTPIDLRRRHPFPQPPPTAPHEQKARAVLGNEEVLLGALVDHPQRITEITAWLQPTDFADAGHAALYQAVAALGHRREPVDPLTVLWEAQRRGILARGLLTVDQVRAVCAGGAAADPEYFGELVLQASLLRAAATAAGIVRVMALDASISAAQLLGASAQALQPVEAVRARWAAANGEPPPRPVPTPVPGGRKGAALARGSLPAAAGKPAGAGQQRREAAASRTPPRISP